MTALRLGTRGSLLARTQSGLVADMITAATGYEVELVTIRSEGDDLTIPLDAPKRPGAFVATLRDALLSGEVDLAVHSAKDLPSAPVPGLTIAAFPPRADPRDAIYCPAGLGPHELPDGARIGTSSPRRAKGLHRVRPDLQIIPIRGNVDTRLAKADSGEVDASVLAAAGLERLGYAGRITAFIEPNLILPAPAQGVLAVECRTGELAGHLSVIDDLPTRLAAVAERSVLGGLEATCTTAIGALATWIDDTRLELHVEISEHRGINYARISRTGVVTTQLEATTLGATVCDALLGDARQ